jgi:hypothetical protein
MDETSLPLGDYSPDLGIVLVDCAQLRTLEQMFCRSPRRTNDRLSLIITFIDNFILK